MQTRHFLPLIGLILLAGCAGLRDSAPTEPQRDILIEPTQDDEEPLSREEAEDLFDPEALGEYDVATIQAAEFTDGEEMHITRFSRARLFARFLESLDLVELMSRRQREKLYTSLFNGIPARLTGTYRAVAIGQFFSSGEPLYVLLGVAEPSDRAPSGTERTLMMQTSALSDNNRVATFEFGRLVDMTVNVSLIYYLDSDGNARDAVAFSAPPRPAVEQDESGSSDPQGAQQDGESSDGEGESSNNEETESAGESSDGEGDSSDEQSDEHEINESDGPEGLDPPEEIEFDAGLDDQRRSRELPNAPVERIRLARRIVEAGPLERRREVPRLVDPLIDDATVPDHLRAEAMYTRFLYSLSVRDLDTAERTAERLNELVEESHESDSPRVDEVLAYRVQQVIPIMLETYEYDQEDDHTFDQSPENGGEASEG